VPAYAGMTSILASRSRGPPIQLAARFARVLFLVRARAGGELDDVAVRIAQVNRVDEAVIDDAAYLAAGCLRLIPHLAQHRLFDFERDVQIEVVLTFELERHVGRFEEREERTIVQAIERVEHVRHSPGLRLLDLERVGEREPQEALVELPRLLGAAAAI